MDSAMAYDVLPQAALAGMGTDVWASWRSRYDADGDLEVRARALIDRAETALRNAEKEVTIWAVWVLLANRAGDDADMRAAAALAGVALGLRPT